MNLAGEEWFPTPIVTLPVAKHKVGGGQTTDFANQGSSGYGGFLERFALHVVSVGIRRHQTVSRR